jgi:hypothetical protein
MNAFRGPVNGPVPRSSSTGREPSGLRAEKVEERVNATVERGIKEAITAQTRSLVTSVLVAVAAIAALAFGVAG